MLLGVRSIFWSSFVTMGSCIVCHWQISKERIRMWRFLLMLPMERPFQREATFDQLNTRLHVGDRSPHIRLFECHDLDVSYALVMLEQGGALTQILCLWCCYEKLGGCQRLSLEYEYTSSFVHIIHFFQFVAWISPCNVDI